MPTYDYDCEACGVFELRHSILSEPLTICPTCEGPCRRKIGRGGALIFKGTGFYCTDYPKKKPPKDKPKAKEKKG